MNGNVKRVDNGEKNKDGKHSCFLILSHKTREALKKDTAALSVYLELLGQADSRFNATAENIAAEVKLAKKTVRAALERLQGEYHLLKVEQEKDISKAAQRKTRRGFIVPNTARLYYVYYEPFAEQERQADKGQQRRYFAGEVGERQEGAPAMTGQQERQADKGQQRRYFAGEAGERQEGARPAMTGGQQQQELLRKQHVKEIAEYHGLLSEKQLKRVIEQLKIYKKLRGVQASDSMINYIAMQLSHNSGYSVNADMSLKA